MGIYVKDIMTLMDEWAPSYLAEKWDHPGMQIGTPSKKVERILVSLDVTRNNVRYAANHGIQMIISHHPFLFKSLHVIDVTCDKGKIIKDVMKNDITLFAAHTNLDTAQQGVNDALSKALGLQNCKGLVPVYKEYMNKVTIYTSAMNCKVIQKRIKEQSGNEIRFFYVLEDEDNMDRLVRLECGVPMHLLTMVKTIIQDIDQNIAFDIHVLENHAKQEFMGRIGYLPKEMTGVEAILYIKEKLQIPCIRYAGDDSHMVKKVALLGGSGMEFFSFAKAAGADLYLTADAKYHDAQEASENLLIVDGGHFYTERVIVSSLAKRLRDEFEKRQWAIEVEEDSDAVDIFHYL